MYNQELKERFLSSYNNASTAEQYKDALTKISLAEESLGLDIFNFTNQQFDEATHEYISAKTLGGVRRLTTPISVYIGWAIKQGLSKGYLDYNNIFNKGELNSYLYDDAANSSHLYREEVYDLCDDLVNYIDKALLILIFEGIKDDYELRNLKYEDIDFDTGTVNVSNEKGKPREFEITNKKSLDIILQSKSEKIYYLANGYANKKEIFNLVDSPYIIRKINKSKKDIVAGAPVEKGFINSKINRIFKGKKDPKTGEYIEEPFLSDCLFLNTTNLFDSGFFDFCMNMESQKGTLDLNDFRRACERYGINPSYASKYKKQYLDWNFKNVYEIGKSCFSPEMYDEVFFQYQVEQEKIPSKVTITDEPKKPQSKEFHNGMASYPRDSKTAKKAIAYANYLCELDTSHKDFISKVTKQNYVEAHHIIPMEYQDDFQSSLDVESNIISVCATCHKKLHHASFAAIKSLLDRMYVDRENRLKKSGIIISKSDLYNYYK